MKIKHILNLSFLLFALGPALVIIFLSASFFKNHVEEGFITTLTIATNIEISNINSYFNSRSDQINPLHSIPQLEKYLLEYNTESSQQNTSLGRSISEYLQKRCAANASILSLRIIGTQGKILAASEPDEMGATFTNLPDSQHFATKNYFINPLPDAPATETSRFALTILLKNDARTLGYVYVEYNTEYFEKALQNITMHRSGSMFLLDMSGKIIASSRSGVVGKKIAADPSLAELAKIFFAQDFALHDSGVMRYPLRGMPRIAYYTVIPETQWILLSAMNDKAFSAFLRNFDTTLLVLCCIVLFVSLCASFVVSRRIVAPIERFIATVHNARNGDKTARFHYEKNNELGTIAEAFNSLVHATNKRTAKLKALSSRLIKQQQQLRTLTHNIPGGLFRCKHTRKGDFLFISDGFLDILSFDRISFAERCENCLSMTISPEEREGVLDDITRQLEEKQSFEVEYMALMGFGSCCWVQVKGELKSNPRTGEQWVDGLAIDISEHVQAQEYLDQTMGNLRETLRELKISEERLRLIIDHSSDIIFEWSAAQRYIYLSPGFKKRFGYAPLLPDGFTSLKHFKEIHPEDLHRFRNWLLRLNSSTPPPVEDFRIRTADGRYLWTRHQITLIRDKNENVVRAVGLLIDVHAAKCTELLLLDKAERDALSGLFNRATFEEKAQAALVRIRKSQGQLAFMFLDIDDFRTFNTDYGHAFGDRIIAFIGNILAKHVSYAGFAGRRGGDEFVICCEHIHSGVHLQKLAEDIQASLNAGLTARGNVQVSISCSIGIVQVKTMSTSFEDLINAADLAMYDVKKRGKGSYSLVQV